jgi:hypothetical protein
MCLQADESVSDEEEGSEASSEEESEEAQQAAAGIESLGITTWMGERQGRVVCSMTAAVV